MTSRQEEIAQRKQALIDKAGRERTELAAAYRRMTTPMEIGGTLLAIGRTLKSHPIIAAGLSSFLVSGYAGKGLRSASEVLQLWKLLRPIWRWWTKRRGA